MSEQLGARSMLRKLKESVPEWNNSLPEMPLLAHRFLEQATTGKLQVEWTSRELKRLRLEMRRNNRRSSNAIIGTGLIVTAAIIYGLDGAAPFMIMGAPLLSWLCGGLGVLLLVLNWPDDRD
jgi:ubiquinone biosynthesis protein